MRDFTPHKKLLAMAVPATLAVMMGPIASTIDTIVVGQRNGEWLAPFAGGNAVINTVQHGLNFLVYAVSARVAQAYGQKDPQLLHRETVTGLALALVLGLCSMVIMAICEGPLLTGLMGLSGPLLGEASSYFTWRLPGLPLMLMSSAAIGVLRGYQQMTATVVMVVASTAINAGLSYACLYLWDTGLWGAAFGTTVSFFVSVAVGWLYIKRHDAELRLTQILPTKTLNKLIDWQSFSGDAKYQFIRSTLLNGTLLGLTAICSHAGTMTVAGHQILYQIMVVVACILSGLALSASSMGGEAIGQGRYDEWRTMCNASLQLNFAISVFVALALYLTAEPMLALFTSDTALRDYTAPTYDLYILMVPLFGLLYQMEGILYGPKMFKYVAMSLIYSALLFFAPALLLARSAGHDTLWAAWFAFGALNLGRLAVNGYNYWRAAQHDYRLVKAHKL